MVPSLCAISPLFFNKQKRKRKVFLCDTTLQVDEKSWLNSTPPFRVILKYYFASLSQALQKKNQKKYEKNSEENKKQTVWNSPVICEMMSTHDRNEKQPHRIEMSGEQKIGRNVRQDRVAYLTASVKHRNVIQVRGVILLMHANQTRKCLCFGKPAFFILISFKTRVIWLDVNEH